MAFFNQFPQVSYDFNRTGTIQQMVNIFRSVRGQSAVLNDSTLYKNYYIRNGMRPDVVSEKLYGTPDFYWTFFIINDFLHDGLQAWPLSEEGMQNHIKQNYKGKALQFTPETIQVNDVAVTKNSIAGKLELGGLVYGISSGAVGRIIRKDIDLNLIVLDDIVDGITGRNPQTGQTDLSVQGGSFQVNEFLQSKWTDAEGVTQDFTSGDTFTNTLSPSACFDYADAPAYYFLEGDEAEEVVTSPDILPTEISQVTPIFSELQWNSDLQSQIVNFDNTLINNNILGDNGFYATNVTAAAPLISNGGYYVGENTTIARGEIVFKTNRRFLYDKNEARSSIKVINPSFITDFVEEFERVLNV